MGDLLAKNIFVFFAVLLKILYMSERRHKLSTLVSPFQSSALALPAEALPPKQLASPPPEPAAPGAPPGGALREPLVAKDYGEPGGAGGIQDGDEGSLHDPETATRPSSPWTAPPARRSEEISAISSRSSSNTSELIPT